VLRPHLDAERERLIGMIEDGLEGHHITSADHIGQGRAESGVLGRSLQQSDQKLSIISAHVSHDALPVWIEQARRNLSLKRQRLGRREVSTVT